MTKNLFALAEQYIVLDDLRGMSIEWSNPQVATEIINETLIQLDEKILKAFDETWDNTPDNDKSRKGFYGGRYLQNNRITCFRARGTHGKTFIYCRRREGRPMQTVRELSNWFCANKIEPID